MASFRPVYRGGLCRVGFVAYGWGVMRRFDRDLRRDLTQTDDVCISCERRWKSAGIDYCATCYGINISGLVRERENVEKEHYGKSDS